jgi:hypothetical protein
MEHDIWVWYAMVKEKNYGESIYEETYQAG